MENIPVHVSIDLLNFLGLEPGTKVSLIGVVRHFGRYIAKKCGKAIKGDPILIRTDERIRSLIQINDLTFPATLLIKIIEQLHFPDEVKEEKQDSYVPKHQHSPVEDVDSYLRSLIGMKSNKLGTMSGNESEYKLLTYLYKEKLVTCSNPFQARLNDSLKAILDPCIELDIQIDKEGESCLTMEFLDSQEDDKLFTLKEIFNMLRRCVSVS